MGGDYLKLEYSLVCKIRYHDTEFIWMNISPIKKEQQSVNQEQFLRITYEKNLFAILSDKHPVVASHAMINIVK